jgi:hypothetical protein
VIQASGRRAISAGESARGLAQSRTLRVIRAHLHSRQRLGVRRPSAAFLINLLKANYLLLFDKKDLTNGIDGFILRGMNTNEIAPKTNARMNRIKKVSKCFRLFLQFGFPFMMLVAVIQAILTGVQAKPFEIAQGTEGWLIVRTAILLVWGLFGFVILLVWYWTSLKLFRFFEKGMLFTAETARCLKIIGFTFFAGIIGELGVYLCNPLPDKIWPAAGPIGDISTCIYNGAFFVFLGWLFDEAQKIREEQELTV